MATITRRNRGFLSNPNDDALNAETADGAGLARRWWGWGRSRRPSALTALGDASPLSVRNPVINGVVGSGVAGAGAAGSRRLVGQRAAQILWIAVLVYTFLGLPVFGRVLNFLRFAHRVSLAAVLKGLVAGLCQDVAILLQAATVICLVKLVFHESSLLSVGAGASGAASGALSDRGPGSWLRSDSGGAGPVHGGSFGHSSRALRIPVYMPVLTSEYEPSHSHSSSSDDPAVATTTSSAAADSFGKHTTLLAGVAGPTTSYLSSLAPRGSWFFSKVRHALATTVTLVLIHAVVVIATVASVVDFCLQVTMHPRLNRAFVEVFLNYAAQFAASLMDEEVLTRTVMWSWAVYVALVVALTFGFYANKFPLLPSVLFAPGGFSSAACFACDRHLHPGKRKDSMLSSTAASSASAAGNDAPRGFLALAMLPFTWFTAKPLPLPTHRPRRRSGQNHSLFPSQQSSSLFGCGSSASSSFVSFAAKPSPFTVVLRGVVVSIAVTLFALSMSLIVDGHGVDMKLMSNAMFSLQTEGFFLKTHSINREEINCTLASNELLATLGKSEVYDIAGLGNDDRCALLWRKTIGFTGDTLFDLTLKNVTVAAPTTVPVTTEASIPAPATVRSDSVGSTLNEQANATDATDASAVPDDTKTTATPTGTTTTEPTTEPTTTKASMPNIIVINMESWRALDVGVLGGAERKAKFGQSATPEFDALAKTGILYRKHFTQCVQTTRTLLTMLFGMLPSCTETTALKRYATSLNVRGLPQFLKSRGYFNMFWSAVNLSWEYWDKFLLQNGFDKLVDDRKIRKMLHEARQYKNREDDHFSWGMHDHLSFDMLLHAIESAHNATRDAAAAKANRTHSAGGATLQLPDDPTRVETTPAVLERNDSATSATPTKKPVPKSLLRARGGVDSVDRAKRTTTTPTAKKAAANEAAAPVLAGWEGLQEPYFIDMYSISSHNPWALPADYVVPPELASLYTAYTKKYIDAMYFSDEMLGKFVRSMRAKGLLRNTVVVIQGDHGYGRMEHNNPSIADSGIYDEGAHVPFLLLADDLLADADKGTEVSQLTMQSDLMATIADLLGVSPEAPLYQHGYGHSMRRRRSAPTADELAAATVAASALAVDDNGDLVDSANTNSREPATVAPATAAVLAERRVLLCNPFNGMTKGVRTEERKYAFFSDRSFKVFEQATDPSEKSPVRAGFDVATMDVEVKTMFAFATEHVELNQFLFEANKFSTPLPVGKSRGRRSHHHYMQPQQQVHVQRVPIPLTDGEGDEEDDRASLSLVEGEHADDKDAQHHHAGDSRGDETTAAIATARPHSAPAVPPDTR